MHRAPVKQYFARARRFEAGDDTQEGRLAAA
jgi:hypothetical protein